MSKGNSDYFADRNRELKKAFLTFFAHMEFMDAVAAAAQSPCSRFWVSAEQMAKRLRADKPLARQADMYEEIRRRCNSDFSIENVERVVYSPAPRFYISLLTARKLIYKSFPRQ